MTPIIAFIKKWLPYAVGFILLVLLSFIAGKCSTHKDRDIQISNLRAARDSVYQSFVEIGGLKYTVSTKDAIILSKDDALQAQIIENDRLKALQIKELVTNVELSGTINILRDSLKLPINTVFITIKDTSGVNQDYIRIPVQFLKVSDRYVKLNAGVNINKTAWYNLSVPVTGEISIGYVRAGFLKTKPVGIFTSSNPHLTVNSMDVLIVKEPDKFYNKTWFHVVAGAVAIEGLRIFLIK